MQPSNIEKLEEGIKDLKVKIFDVMELQDDMREKFTSLDMLRQQHLAHLKSLKDTLKQAKESLPKES